MTKKKQQSECIVSVNCFNGKLISILAAIITFTICGCGNSNLLRSSGRTHTVSVLDKAGKRIFDIFLNSFKLSETEYLDVDGQKYETPYHKQIVLENKLKPLKDKSGQIPVKVGDQQINLDSWSSIELEPGEILICGVSESGVQSSAELSKKTWIYNYHSNKLTAGPDMVHSHVKPNIIRLTDGRIVLSGGHSLPSIKPISAVEIFDPKGKTFFDCGDMCLPRYNHSSVQINDHQVLIAGGENISKNSMEPYTNSVEILDLKTMKHMPAGLLGR